MIYLNLILVVFGKSRTLAFMSSAAVSFYGSVGGMRKEERRGRGKEGI